MCVHYNRNHIYKRCGSSSGFTIDGERIVNNEKWLASSAVSSDAQDTRGFLYIPDCVGLTQ